MTESVNLSEGLCNKTFKNILRNMNETVLHCLNRIFIGSIYKLIIGMGVSLKDMFRAIINTMNRQILSVLN